MSDSLKQDISKRASEILSELGVTDCDIIFTDFSEVARDPLKKAQGYHPEYRAYCTPSTRVIEINSATLQNDDFMWYCYIGINQQMMLDESILPAEIG